MRTLATTIVGFAIGLAAVGAYVVLEDNTPAGTPVELVIVPDLCLNPSLEWDGSVWVTGDALPRPWRNHDQIPGVLWVDGDVGTFRASGMADMRYERVGTGTSHSRELHCAI